MNDEIKEKIKAYYIDNDIDKVLDYITNLQEENERLKKLCNKYEKEHSTEFKIWKDERQQLRDYKSRNEKAIDKLNTQLAFTSSYQLNYQSAMNIIEETKSILQGSEKSE